MTSNRFFRFLILVTSLAILAGCGSPPPVITDDPGKHREDMVKWHQEHDKIPSPPAGG